MTMGGRSGGRTIVLGADSLDLLLVERWAAAGLLPFFESLLQSGSLVRLSTVSRVLQGALWPSLLSGRSPGQHGMFYGTQLVNGTYNLDLTTADHASPDPFYARLDAHGVRCAIVDIPSDIPIRGFNGLHVVDWLTEFKYWRFETQPAAVKREIRGRLGVFHESGGYGPTIDTLEGHRLLRQRLEKSVLMKSELTQQLLERNDLDHIFVVFAEPHKGGHFLWKYMDPAHPDHVAAEPYLRDALLGIYQLLDKTLAELSSQLTHRDNLLIFSDHGMQANYRGDQFMGTILQRLGLERASRRAGAPALASGPSAARSRARSALGALIKGVAPEFIWQRLRRQFGAAVCADWSQTRVFLLPTDRNSYLRVNLRGREPQGIVSPGKEYRELLTFIASELRALVNVKTGQPAVEEVFKIHELYPGPRVDDLPDMAILWRSDAPLDAVKSPRLGQVEIKIREDRSGNHRPAGFLLARGPAIRSQAKELYGDILQIPATMLALHGIPRPGHYAMQPLNELLVHDH
jgi:predicted AlkP superfamily phosphohydrolase/phosphomutase